MDHRVAVRSDPERAARAVALARREEPAQYFATLRRLAFVVGGPPDHSGHRLHRLVAEQRGRRRDTEEPGLARQDDAGGRRVGSDGPGVLRSARRRGSG